MGDGVANGSVLDLGALSERALRAALPARGDDRPRGQGRCRPRSSTSRDFDVARDEHLARARCGCPGSTEVFGHCDGYSPDDRLGFLRAHVDQGAGALREHAPPRRRADPARGELREALETFLDERARLPGRGRPCCDPRRDRRATSAASRRSPGRSSPRRARRSPGASARRCTWWRSRSAAPAGLAPAHRGRTGLRDPAPQARARGRGRRPLARRGDACTRSPRSRITSSRTRSRRSASSSPAASGG